LFVFANSGEPKNLLKSAIFLLIQGRLPLDGGLYLIAVETLKKIC